MPGILLGQSDAPSRRPFAELDPSPLPGLVWWHTIPEFRFASLRALFRRPVGAGERHKFANIDANQ
ncbi:MAG: hypothetical protein QOG27_407 [Verrucomicrobiota bacterium]